MNRFEFDAGFKIIAAVVVAFISFAVLERGKKTKCFRVIYARDFVEFFQDFSI